MLAIKQHTFSEKDLGSFLHFPQTIAFFEQLKLTTDGVLATFRVIAEESCWNIDSILNEAIQNIEDESLRNVFRRFLISQKYGISPWYCGQQYSVCKVSDNSVLVDTPLQTVPNKECKISYTIFLSPQGDIKVPESEKVWVFDTLKHGFHVVGNGKSGIYTWTGNVLFPCLFDAVDNGWPAETLEYKGNKYVFTICVTSSEVNPAMFRDDKTISFCCEDKVCSIAPLDENYSQNNLDKLREIMYSLHDKTAN